MYSSELVVRDGKCRRAAPRSSAGFDADMRGRGVARSLCRVIDISSTGARLRLYQDLEPETSIRLSLPGAGAIDAHIVWANGREAGCRFDEPLDDGTLAALRISAERG